MAKPNSRSSFIDYCLRRLGDPVIEINVAPEQIEDKVDDALQKFAEYHSDATFRGFLKHQVTAADISNQYIPISPDIVYISRLFPVSSSFGASRDMFDIKYQMMLNDITSLYNFVGDFAFYEQMQQYLSLIDMTLNGTPQVHFSRKQDRLYIFGDFQDGDIKEGDYLVAEIYQIVDPQTHTAVWNDAFLKDYATALIKQQWGTNLLKFEGMMLPGGVTLNGRQIYDDATADLEKILESLRLEKELPVDFFVG